MVVDAGGGGADERAEEETGARIGMAEVKIWVLEAEMWVIVVVEVEVQVVVTYLVAAWAEAMRRERRRVVVVIVVVIGWRIVKPLRAKALVVRCGCCCVV